MKKIFFFLLLGTMMSLQMRAQVNPKPGFIITNHILSHRDTKMLVFP